MMKRADKNRILFLLLIPALSLLLAGAALLDARFGGTELFSAAAKLLLSAALLRYGTRRGLQIRFRGGDKHRWLPLAAFVPAALNLLRVACRPDAAPSAAAVLLGTLGVLLTVLWEELYYRWLARALFVRGDGRVGSVLWTALLFSLAHAVNFLFADPVSVAFQMLMAFALGVFWMALYLRGTLALAVLSHFALNMSSRFFELFAREPNAKPFAGDFAFALLLAQISAALLAGLALLKPRKAS